MKWWECSDQGPCPTWNHLLLLEREFVVLFSYRFGLTSSLIGEALYPKYALKRTSLCLPQNQLTTCQQAYLITTYSDYSNHFRLTKGCIFWYCYYRPRLIATFMVSFSLSPFYSMFSLTSFVLCSQATQAWACVYLSAHFIPLQDFSHLCALRWCVLAISLHIHLSCATMPHSYALRARVSFRNSHETHNIYFAQALLCVYWLVGACGKFQMYVYIYVCHHICMYVYIYVYAYVFMYMYTHFRH